jgi:transcriptional regulator with XRE-family HTH domain
MGEPAGLGPHPGGADSALREQKEWSLETLSARCGVSRAILSQIERGQVHPTLAVTLNIPRAFDMSIGELIQMPGAFSSVQVIRAADRACQFRSDQNCRARTLSLLNLEKDVEFYHVQLRRGGALRSAAHFTGTRKFLSIQSGRVRVEPGDAVVFLTDIHR